MTADEVLLVGNWLVSRATRLWPDDPDFAEAVLIATSCQIMDVPHAVDEPDVQAGIRTMLTLEGEEAGTALEIGTVGGIIQVAQLGPLTDVEIIRRLVGAAEARLGDRRWHCPHCSRVYPESFGPDHCPDCGSRLIRLRAPRPGDAF